MGTARVVGNQSGGLRLHAHECADAVGSGILSALLEHTACQHEGDNHHRCIEIGMPGDATGAPYCITKERIECAEEKSNKGGHGHQRVHRGGAITQLAPRTDVELAPAIQHVGQRQQQSHLIGKTTGSHTVGARSELEPSHGDGHH